KKLFIFGGGGFLILIVLVNLLGGDGGGVEVTVEEAALGSVVSRVSASGRIFPVTEVKINSQVSARIDQLLVVEGQVVERGQILAQLDRTLYEARVQGARAMLNTQQASAEASQATLRQAEDALNIARAMAEQQVGAQQDMRDAQNGFEAAKARYNASLAQVSSAEASLDQALEDLSRTTLRAPMEGTVTALIIEEGEMVLGTQMTMGTQLMAIADLSRMEVEVDVDETDVVAVEVGQLAEVEVDAIPDTLFGGIVTEIANAGVTLGAGTQMEVTNFAVKVELFDSDPRLRRGMSAAVDVITETHENVVHIPMQALTARRREDLVVSNVIEGGEVESSATTAEEEYVEVVFVLTAENTVETRVVVTGISGATHIEIISGLEEGEQVVTGPFRLLSRTLKDGDRVKVTESLLEDERER
ncbi:efflux RND transporter periplasmic adaptor subunit, partial [Gemmatimonadota bacterium]